MYYIFFFKVTENKNHRSGNSMSKRHHTTDFISQCYAEDLIDASSNSSIESRDMDPNGSSEHESGEEMDELDDTHPLNTADWTKHCEKESK